MTVLAGNIKFYRKEAGLSQQGLADSVGLSQNYLSMVERGERELSDNLVGAVEHALNIEIGVLGVDVDVRDSLNNLIELYDLETVKRILGEIEDTLNEKV